MKHKWTHCFALIVALISSHAMAEPAKESPEVIEEIELDKIWSAVQVKFHLLTKDGYQYIAYFNSERKMIVAMRKLGDATFQKTVLSSKSEEPPTRETSSTIQGWDSHNDITMAVDKKGHLHLAGNMHANPLTYFRAKKPFDCMSLEQVDSMTGELENYATYPRFMNIPDGRLVFSYRYGGSGNGDEIYNVYNEESATWSRHYTTPLISGEGERNAYPTGPTLGPDGFYHLLWVWRETSDASTCHDLSYARSRDMVNWETAAGAKLTLPIVLDSPGTIIDPIPMKGGIINGCHKFSFDSKNRLIVSYYKHDENGDTQVYAARFEEDKWRIRTLTKWKGKHLFEGGGTGPATFGTSLRIKGIQKYEKGKLSLAYDHWKNGIGLLIIEEESLALVDSGKDVSLALPHYPAELTKLQSDFPGMKIQWIEDSGSPPDPQSRYVLRWESLGPNRDLARTGELPKNSSLMLYKIRN
jgi:hypothetical protein